MAKLFRRKPQPTVETTVPDGFDIRTWTPENRKQARSAIFKGIGWFFDNDKKSLALTVVALLFALGVAYKGLGFDRYQPVVEEKMEALAGFSVVPQSWPQHSRSSPKFITVGEWLARHAPEQRKPEPIIVNGKQFGFYDPAVLLWAEWRTAHVVYWRPGMDSPSRIKDILPQSK